MDARRRGEGHAAGPDRRPRLLQRLRRPRCLLDDRRRLPLEPREGPARRRARLQDRGRPDVARRRLRRDRPRPLPHRRRRTELDQREAADRFVHRQLAGTGLLLRQHRHRRRGAGRRHVRAQGRCSRDDARLAGRSLPQLQRQAAGSGQRRLPVGHRGGRQLRPRCGQRRHHAEPGLRSRGARRGPRRRPELRLPLRRRAELDVLHHRAGPALQHHQRRPARRRHQPDREDQRPRRHLRLARLRQDLAADGERRADEEPGQRVVAQPAAPARHLGRLPGDLQRVDQAGPDAHGQRRTEPAGLRTRGALDQPAPDAARRQR